MTQLSLDDGREQSVHGLPALRRQDQETHGSTQENPFSQD
jgi:hypothetical protein